MQARVNGNKSEANTLWFVSQGFNSVEVHIHVIENVSCSPDFVILIEMGPCFLFLFF